MKSRPASISSKGTFTAKLPLKNYLDRDSGGHVTVTGRFGRVGHEKGHVITKIRGSASCNGESRYSTRAR